MPSWYIQTPFSLPRRQDSAYGPACSIACTAPGTASDYSIILFPEDRALWATGSRRIMSVRTANDGTFLFNRVPAGDYEIAAVDDVEPGEWYDPAFLQRLMPAAVKVTIAEGEKKVQDLKIGGA